MRNSLFSIITVTYNASATVERTLESIASQTFDDYEHIIVDGASTDGTLCIVENAPGEMRRRILSEPDSGLYDAMNKGISMATGTYLIFLNSGDKFHSPDTLALIAETIRKSGEPGVVYGQTDLVDDDGRFMAPRHLSAPENLSLADFSRGMVVCHQAFVAKRSIAPFFSLKYKYSSDYEWCIICLMHSKKNVYINDVLIDYLAEGVTTSHRKQSLRERFRIMSTYYGFWPTLWRHFGFIPRYLRHQKKMKALTPKPNP